MRCVAARMKFDIDYCRSAPISMRSALGNARTGNSARSTAARKRHRRRSAPMATAARARKASSISGCATGSDRGLGTRVRACVRTRLRDKNFMSRSGSRSVVPLRSERERVMPVPTHAAYRCRSARSRVRPGLIEYRAFFSSRAGRSGRWIALRKQARMRLHVQVRIAAAMPGIVDLLAGHEVGRHRLARDGRRGRAGVGTWRCAAREKRDDQDCDQ